jgi:hypothetical protein
MQDIRYSMLDEGQKEAKMLATDLYPVPSTGATGQADKSSLLPLKKI